MEPGTAPHDDLIAQYLETGDETLLASLPTDEADDAREMRALLAEPAIWEEPSADLAARIDAAVRVTPQAGAVTTLSAARGARPARRINPIITAIAGVAAGIALAFAFASFRDSADNGEEVAVAATDLAPGVGGSAILVERSAGFEITLELVGLERAPKGFFYEAWVKGDKGLVPIGTFHTGGHIVLWSGVDIAEYPQLTVTLEPEDGDPASSGQRLLTAELPAP